MGVSIHAYQEGDIDLVLPRLRPIFMDELKGRVINFSGDAHVLTFRMDDLIIAIVGGRPISLGVLQTWALISVDAAEAAYAFTKSLKMVISEFLKNYHRVQLSVRDGYEAEMRWPVLLGFKKEGLMKGYGHDRHDCWMFGRTT